MVFMGLLSSGGMKQSSLGGSGVESDARQAAEFAALRMRWARACLACMGVREPEALSDELALDALLCVGRPTLPFDAFCQAQAALAGQDPVVPQAPAAADPEVKAVVLDLPENPTNVEGIRFLRSRARAAGQQFPQDLEPPNGPANNA